MPNLKKDSLRRAFKERRAVLSSEEQMQMSGAICQNILGLEQYKRATGVAAYWPMTLEIDIKPIINDALSHNRRVYLPRVIQEPRGLRFCRYDGDPKTLAAGPFGLSEPDGEPSDIDEIDLVIVPGLAFDLHGHRLGYGTGYYDRFLKQTKAQRVGVAFDVMIIDILPVAEHDVAMNSVVTESRIISMT